MHKRSCVTYASQGMAGGEVDRHTKRRHDLRMANPYSQPYEQFRGMGKVAGPSAEERRKQKESQGMADILRMLGQVAPMAGSAIGGALGAAGGPLGMAGGAALGGSIGQAAGSLAGAGADMAERGALERQQERDRQIGLLLNAFGRGR
jgi:hypothetical protein